jgi:hypothetical protein
MSELTGDPVVRCFVIGPIGNKFAPTGDPARELYEDALDVFEKVILPACQAASLEPVRADQIALTGEITEQVFRHLYEDEVVIADVSGGNPNVMYELGLRHTRPMLTIQLGEYGQLPFDVSAVRTIQFSRSERGLIDARKSLQKALEFGLADPGDGVTATRIWNGAIDDSDSRDVGLVDDKLAERDEDDLDEEGFLERLANLEQRIPMLTQTTEEIGAVVSELGTIAVASNDEITEVNSANAPMATRLSVVARFATALQPSADELTVLTNQFLADMTDLDIQLQGIFSYVESNPQMLANDGVDGFLSGISGMTRSSREAMENISQFGAAMDGLAGMSRVLRKPAKQISAAVRTMLKAILVMDLWDESAARLKQRLSGM